MFLGEFRLANHDRFLFWSAGFVSPLFMIIFFSKLRVRHPCLKFGEAVAVLLVWVVWFGIDSVFSGLAYAIHEAGVEEGM